MKTSFLKAMDALGMSISEYINLMTAAKQTDQKVFFKILHSIGVLDHKMYRFMSGPFKGQRFLCTSPDVSLMNKHPHFSVVFLGGKLDGLRTSSLITYDQRIICMEPTWRKLL